MADFAEFAIKVAPVFGFGEHIAGILQRLAETQTQFVVEDEPLLELIDFWLTDKTNEGRWMTTSELLQALQWEAEGNAAGRPPVPCEVRTTHQLGQKLTNLESTLQILYGYEECIGRARGRRVRFTHPRAMEMEGQMT
jgi:hypothetical protein